jgi:hypothetical protein
LRRYKGLGKGKTMQKVVEELVFSVLLLVYGRGNEMKLESSVPAELHMKA